jgi:hypothetical protein
MALGCSDSDEYKHLWCLSITADLHGVTRNKSVVLICHTYVKTVSRSFDILCEI